MRNRKTSQARAIEALANAPTDGDERVTAILRMLADGAAVTKVAEIHQISRQRVHVILLAPWRAARPPKAKKPYVSPVSRSVKDRAKEKLLEITPEHHRETVMALRMAAQGISISDIAAVLNVSKACIYQWIKTPKKKRPKQSMKAPKKKRPGRSREAGPLQRPRLKQEQINLAVHLRSEGWSYADVSQKIGCSQQGIRRALISAGYETSTAKQKITPEMVNSALSWLRNGDTYPQVAVKLGVSVAAINNAVRASGLTGTDNIRNRRKQIAESRRNQAVQMRQQNHTLTAIAIHLGVTPQSVQSMLDRAAKLGEL